MRASSVLLVTLTLAASADAVGCSLAASPRFHVAEAAPAPAKPKPRVVLEQVFITHRFDMGNTCDGLGVMSLELKLATAPTGSIEDYGYFLLPVAGVNGVTFPGYPLQAYRLDSDTAVVYWSWAGARPDSDGHFRWTLLVIPVSATGLVGVPQTLCLATDDSCTR